VQHTFPALGRYRVNLSANVTNLFDQDTVTRLFTQPYRDNITLSFTDFFAGFDPAAYAAANRARPFRDDARFLQPDQYLNRRAIRLNARITF
jgi:hypothetical protein